MTVRASGTTDKYSPDTRDHRGPVRPEVDSEIVEPVSPQVTLLKPQPSRPDPSLRELGWVRWPFRRKRKAHR